MKPIRIRDIKGLKKPITVSLETSVIELIRKFIELPVTHQFYIVDNKGKLLGLINRKLLFRSLFHHYLPPSARISELYKLATAENVEEIFVKDVLLAKPNDNIQDLLKMMMERDIYEVPVLDGHGKLIGKLDVIYFLETYLEEQSDLLEK
ncbi:MAG: CBS domain-containing protein [Calditrichaeota bacterium]|nr:CBS domain-containing protein [Calditrichota bacterium]